MVRNVLPPFFTVHSVFVCGFPGVQVIFFSLIFIFDNQLTANDAYTLSVL